MNITSNYNVKPLLFNQQTNITFGNNALVQKELIPKAKTIVKEVSPKVKLITNTSDILNTLYVACKNCVVAESPDEIYENLKNVSNDEKLRVIRKAIKSGHSSILEHAQVTFTVSDISRVCGQMIKAYRHGSATQKSQRYVAAKDEFNYIIPASISKNPKLKEEYSELMQMASDLYLKFVNLGIPPEDARYAYPLSITTSAIATFNLRELLLVENERLCNRAQQEMRKLAEAVKAEVVQKEPWLAEFLIPKCEALGACPEHKSCGKMLNRMG